MGRRAKPGKGKTVRDLEKRLAESLEREKATGEILRVISRSPTDVQPVFDAIVRSGAALCHAPDAIISIADGDTLRLVASVGSVAASVGQSQLVQDGRMPLTRGSVSGRAIVDRRTVHVHDVSAMPDDEFPEGKTLQREYGGRGTTLAVPLLRDDVGLGAITLLRNEVSPFTDRQVALLQTFADQAVIAIENVRLFTETQEALEQQTATSEILGVISRFPTDTQPVFEAIARSAARLCGASETQVLRVEGEALRLVAAVGTPSIPPVRPLTRGYLAGRAVVDRATIQVRDRAQATAEYPETTAHWYGLQSMLAVPLLRERVALGVIRISRTEIRPFTDKQVALLQTFADQAVIAIENARLLSELQEKNGALTQAHARVTEALEQQTATAEILRAIGSAQTDAQRVFDAIARSTVELCDGNRCHVFRVEGDAVHVAAEYNIVHSPDADTTFRAMYPAPLTAEDLMSRAIRERRVLQVSVPHDDPSRTERQRELAKLFDFQTIMAVPILREDVALGGILVSRRDPHAFSTQHVELVKTFADQAVIAIENVRLFTETKEALERQTATSEILQVISRSPTDTQPVFDAIVQSAVTLCGAVLGAIYRREGDLVHVVGLDRRYPEAAEVRAAYPAPVTSALMSCRAIRENAVIHVPDTETAGALPPEGLRLARVSGFRSVVAVPMRREGDPIGAILVGRPAVGPFPDEQIALLQTFADQAVIAIENVRLFNELQARTAELTRSVEQLTALGEVGQAVSSSLDLETVLTTIVSRAVQLSGLDGGVVFEYDAGTETFVQRAAIGTANRATTVRQGGVRRGEGVVGRTAVTLQPVQIPDISVAGTYEGRIREDLIAAGVRALVAVPILREGRLIGGLAVNRNQPGEVSPDTVGLLQTFAAQSALAIDNARLFREIEDKSRQLEAASRHKSEFLANMSHELRTPMNAILGFSEVLAEGMFGEINDKQAEYLRDILESGRHLLSLINDILDLSKIEAGRMELEPTEFDLPGAIDNALTLVRERASRRGISLGREIDERVGAIRGDERKVKQVLLNLLSNAIKFTPEGGRIDVRAAVSDGVVEVSVTDTGVGIAPEDQEAVFEEFRQVGTADRKVEGTGLGLALSRKFIELHGGRIRVASEVGQGSTFTFTLPVRHGE